jgi:hypothetical protein
LGLILPKIEIFTKPNCERCLQLKYYLFLHNIRFVEKSLEIQNNKLLLLEDPVFISEFCPEKPCIIYPPIIFFPESHKFYQKQLFGIDGLRTAFLKSIIQQDLNIPVLTSLPDSSSPFGKYFCRNEYVEELLRKYILALGISRMGGDMLYYIQIDKSLKLELIVQFIAALSMFGEENLGKIDKIIIKGLEIEMSILTRHNLIFFVMFKANMVQDYLTDESENCLDLFYHKYQPLLDQNKTNRALYEKFDREMCLCIQNYLVRIGILDCVDCNLKIPLRDEKISKLQKI